MYADSSYLEIILLLREYSFENVRVLGRGASDNMAISAPQYCLPKERVRQTWRHDVRIERIFLCSHQCRRAPLKGKDLESHKPRERNYQLVSKVTRPR